MQEETIMKKIDLVTGGSGFIGSHLVDALISTGREVRVVDNFSNGNEKNISHHVNSSNLEVCNIDVSDKHSLRGVCEGVSRVFHLAALADIVPSINDPEAYYNANVTGTFNILKEAELAKVDKFLYAASSSCYGIPDSYPTKETANIRPEYPYALTKRLGEELVMHWSQIYDLSAISLRLFNVYGPRARTSGTYGAVFGVFLAQLVNGEPLTIVGDGSQTRDFTFVSDVVNAFLMASNSPKTGLSLNVGSTNTVTINHLVKLLNTEKKVYIPKRPGEPDCTWADVSLIEEHLGWKAYVSFEEGVKIMLENIEYWKDAPVWNPKSIGEATTDWFKYLH